MDDGFTAWALRRYPGARVLERVALGDDTGDGGATAKATGYGRPVRLTLQDSRGRRRSLVLHTARADEFGHDRRADRVAQLVQAFDTFPHIPRHAAALDVGLIDRAGALRSVADTGEAYLVTEWVDGTPYAVELRRLAAAGAGGGGMLPAALRRVDALAAYLARLHARPAAPAARYVRALRDLVGGGEGIFGIIDGMGAEVAMAPPARLRELEARCVAWRWRLRDRAARLATIHGDFHPFNVVFPEPGDAAGTSPSGADGPDAPWVLDASRGGAGDPADDLTALTVNYVFFALDAPGAWRTSLGPLWRRVWARYLDATGDRGVLEAAPPFLAWRALVLASPRWYPGLSPDGRDRLLRWVEATLDASALDLDSAEEVAA